VGTHLLYVANKPNKVQFFCKDKHSLASQEIPEFYGLRIFITVFTKAYDCPYSEPIHLFCKFILTFV